MKKKLAISGLDDGEGTAKGVGSIVTIPKNALDGDGDMNLDDSVGNTEIRNESKKKDELDIRDFSLTTDLIASLLIRLL